MLNCKVLYPIPSEDCGFVIGGIQKMAVCNYSASHTFSSSGSDCTIDTISLADGEKWLEITLQDETGYANDTLTVGGSSSAKYIQQQVGGIASRPDCNTLDTYANWGVGTIIIAILLKSGQVQIYGIPNGLTATNFDYATGTAAGDSQGITFLFEGAQPEAHRIAASWDLIEANM